MENDKVCFILSTYGRLGADGYPHSESWTRSSLNDLDDLLSIARQEHQENNHYTYTLLKGVVLEEDNKQSNADEIFLTLADEAHLKIAERYERSFADLKKAQEKIEKAAAEKAIKRFAKFLKKNLGLIDKTTTYDGIKVVTEWGKKEVATYDIDNIVKEYLK